MLSLSGSLTAHGKRQFLLQNVWSLLLQSSAAGAITMVVDSCEIWLKTESFAKKKISIFNIHCFSFALSADENYGRAVLNQYKSQDSLHRYGRVSEHLSNYIAKENLVSFYHILYITRACFIQF